MNNKVLYIPLDDRPVNIDLVIQLANLRGLEIKTPKSEDLGFFLKEGNVEAIVNWLNCEEGDALIISLDMFLYGGLIASRTDKRPYNDAMKILNNLREYKKYKSKLKIYAFSNIMRLSISLSSDESQ